VQPFPDANILILGDPIFRSMLVLHDLEPPLYRVGLAVISDTYGIGDAPINPWGDEGEGTQFTCFTGTKGQKLTQKRLPEGEASRKRGPSEDREGGGSRSGGAGGGGSEVRSEGDVGGGGGVTKHVARRMRYPRKKTKNAPSAGVGGRNTSAAGKVLFFFVVSGGERGVWVHSVPYMQIYIIYIQTHI
jgi:hypothetical protein